MAEPHRWERLAARGKAAAGPLVVFVVIVGLWEATVRLLAIPQYMLPAPSAIAMSFQGNMSELIANGWATLWAALLGYLLGNGFALVMAGFMAEFAPVERALYPWMLALRAVPSVALAPLLLIWIGFNIWPIVITAALICFFPTLVNAIDGFKATDAVTLELMRGLNASRWSVFWRVKLRYSLPNLFSAFKISVASASSVLWWGSGSAQRKASGT
ncbi:ABC transporter permease [Mycolicibacterium conceptionense]|uniref:ABC transporter permease n=1 Tax=Mycolicibacterium conceptionense TaxID=451644 RepID=A0A0U1CXR0_9MYCO|nr:ABC transporter permease [Mycolicibacterium conceptionense]